MRDGRMALVVVVSGRIRRVVEWFGLQLECLRAIEVLVVTDRGRHAVELQADAGGAWPGVGGCSVAFDFTSPAALTCSHY